jgi:hypothetical protein
MKRRTKIIFWIYLIGVVLAEITNLRTGYVMGGFERVHGLGNFILWQATNLLIAATWPLWATVLVLSLLGIDFYI